MDRRQKKTQEAIFQAFITLLKHKSYHRITIQEIIDYANIGRSTFYAHYETKDELLKELCCELFGHVVDSAANHLTDHTHSYNTGQNISHSLFHHLLQHLAENDHSILSLLSCESNEIFLRYFKDSLNELVFSQYVSQTKNLALPHDFLVNHISSSFVELILWWIRGQMKQSPEELNEYFHAVIDPIVSLD
ncbi:MAG: TetR/AcrR family transcriptional regulator [Lachnospiraceae bacterium]|jgi:AcrR family transcriptional regulator|nr:TetR/AcrR family transcriptional regulator [Lachnospiraceae bacterium]